MKSLSLMVGVCLIAAVPLGAQQPHGEMGRRAGQRPGMMDDMMPMMREMMMSMARIAAYTPEHLLARKDSLKLSNDQVTKLTAIREAAKTTHDAAGGEIKTHMAELTRAFQNPSPDTSALRPHFEAAHGAMGKAHWAMLVAAVQSKAVLTDSQRQKVDAWVTSMAQREHTM